MANDVPHEPTPAPQPGADAVLPQGRSDLLESGSRHDHLLFERHWRKQPVRSWLATLWYGLRPGRFWKGVSTHDEINLMGLWLTLLSGPLIFLLTLNALLRPLVAIARFIDRTAHSHDWQRVASVANYAGNHLDDYVSRMLGSVQGTALLLAGWILVPSLLVIVLTWLSGPIAGCRVPRARMLRVVAYSAMPLGLVLGILLWATFAASSLVLGFHGMTGISDGWTQWWMQPAVWLVLDNCLWVAWMGVLFLVPLVYLRAGLHQYLRLPHATRVAAAALAIVSVLVVLTVTRFMMIALNQYS